MIVATKGRGYTLTVASASTSCLYFTTKKHNVIFTKHFNTI